MSVINLLVPDGLLIPDLVVADANATATADLTLRARDILVAIEVTAPATCVAGVVLKPAMYAAAGIEHYWRLEPEQVGETTGLTDPFLLDLDPARLHR
ncbi:Uma2 family endonuclease [Kitasatospora sp. NPDC094011]|uniref:Uma2 family endonuclease n=1 Tax=Kitasatospora sp. NPDC094011 TaxID=3364090 RepID=UPI00382699AF